MGDTGELVGQERARERPPRHVRCGEQRGQSGLDGRQAAGCGPQRRESPCQLGPSFVGVEIRRQGAHRPSVEVEPALRVATGGEEEQRAPPGRMQLVFVEPDVLARDDCQRGADVRVRGERLQLFENDANRSRVHGTTLARMRRAGRSPPFALTAFVAYAPAGRSRAAMSRVVTKPRPIIPRPSRKWSQLSAVLSGTKLAPLS